MSNSYAWAALLGLLALAGATQAQPAASFSPAATYIAGDSPIAISMADVNGDGKLDIVTLSYSDRMAGVLLGTGAGTFGNRASFSTGGGNRLTTLEVADLNGDGRPDLLMATSSGNIIKFLLGAASGTFAAVSQFDSGAGTSIQDLAVADVNGDGKPDIIVAYYDAMVGVLTGTGTGTFNPVTTFSTGAGRTA